MMLYFAGTLLELRRILLLLYVIGCLHTTVGTSAAAGIGRTAVASTATSTSPYDPKTNGKHHIHNEYRQHRHDHLHAHFHYYYYHHHHPADQCMNPHDPPDRRKHAAQHQHPPPQQHTQSEPLYRTCRKRHKYDNDPDCDDNDDCWSGICVDGVCMKRRRPVGATCDDRKDCGGGDRGTVRCIRGVCRRVDIATAGSECEINADCRPPPRSLQPQRSADAAAITPNDSFGSTSVILTCVDNVCVPQGGPFCDDSSDCTITTMSTTPKTTTKTTTTEARTNRLVNIGTEKEIDGGTPATKNASQQTQQKAKTKMLLLEKMYDTTSTAYAASKSCVLGTCLPRQAKGGQCIENYGCWSMVCVNNLCQDHLQELGHTCDDNLDCESHVCIHGICSVPSHDGEVCDDGDDLDCTSFVCIDRQCKHGSQRDGHMCEKNHHCISQACVAGKCLPEKR